MTFSTFAGLSSNLAYITSVFIGYIGTDSIGSFIKRFTAKSRREDGRINNQRKAFLDMRLWPEELITDVRKPGNHGYDVIVGGAIYWFTWITLANLSRQTPKLKSTGAGRYQLFYRMPTYSLARKTSPEKSDAVALADWRSVALYLWLIGWISVRQSTVAAISGLTAGRWLWSVRRKADSLIANSKKCERSEIDAWAESPRLSPLWLSASSSACHAAVNHYRG